MRFCLGDPTSLAHLKALARSTGWASGKSGGEERPASIHIDQLRKQNADQDLPKVNFTNRDLDLRNFCSVAI